MAKCFSPLKTAPHQYSPLPFYDNFANFLLLIDFANAAGTRLGRKAKATTVVVMNGLLLKRSDNSPYWQCYCRLKSTSHRKSTGTGDETQARILALEWFMQLRQHAEQGLSFQRLTFERLADQYLATVIGEAKLAYHKDTIERHFKPFFVEITDIKQITAGTVQDYLVHRRTKNDKEPTPQTLNRENTVLRQMLRYAHIQKWTAEAIIVPYYDETQTAKRRPHFTREEYMTLRRVARKRMGDAARDGKIRHVADNRRLLYDAIILLANSGLRVDELHSLTWRNILWTTGDIQLVRAGKRKSNRKLILRQSAVNALSRIAGRRRDYLREQGLEPALEPAETVIALPTGEAVSDMKTAFRALLRACKFTYADPTNRHSLTSLRHTYATLSLTRAGGKRPSIDVLATQMGTSARMIRAHYGHDTVDDYRDELRG